MTKKTPASSTGAWAVDALVEELAPFLWLDRIQSAQTHLLAVEVCGLVRLSDEVVGGLLASPTPNRDVRRALLDRVEELVTMLGDRLADHPEITIKARREVFEEDGEPLVRWLTFADVRLIIEHD